MEVYQVEFNKEKAWRDPSLWSLLAHISKQTSKQRMDIKEGSTLKDLSSKGKGCYSKGGKRRVAIKESFEPNETLMKRPLEEEKGKERGRGHVNHDADSLRKKKEIIGMQRMGEIITEEVGYLCHST